jgi:DNA-binding transcriptional MocR family regulator
LQGLDNAGRVIYAGTMSKIFSIFAPDICCPEPLIDSMIKVRTWISIVGD